MRKAADKKIPSTHELQCNFQQNNNNKNTAITLTTDPYR